MIDPVAFNLLLIPLMTLLMFILLCLIWGSTWAAIKIGLTDAPPLYSSAFRFIVADSVLVAIALLRREKFPRDLKVVIKMAYPGVYMFGACYALVYFAEGMISSGLTSVLFATFPFFVAILSWWMLPEERLAGLGWLGLAIGFAGILVISYDSLSLSGNLFLGTTLGIAAPLASAYGVLIYKRQFADERLLPVLIIQMSAGGILLLLTAIVVEQSSSFQFTAASIGSILYLAVAGTVVTFIGYYWLLKRMRVTNASLIAFITPVVAVLIGVVLFSEPLRTITLIGSALILCGVVLVGRR